MGRDGYVWEMDRWEEMDMCGRWIGGKGWICVGDGYVRRDGYVWEMDMWEGMDMCGRWIGGKGWICVGDG